MPNPHDTLFHFTFIHPFHAASWLCSLWPAEVATAVDWTSLAPADQRLPGLRLDPDAAPPVIHGVFSRSADRVDVRPRG